MSTSRPTNLKVFSRAPTRPTWLAGFLLLGLVLGLLGSLVIGWQYQIDVEPQLIGLHFLALNAGYVVASAGAQELLRWTTLRTLAGGASALMCASLVALCFVAPPVPVGWRLALLLVLGSAGGFLGTSLLYAFEPNFKSAPAAAMNQAGALFGCGSLLATVTIGIAYTSGAGAIGSGFLAIVPFAFLSGAFKTNVSGSRTFVQNEREMTSHRTQDLRSVATVLLSLLLFFQFGNEWAIAGWLPLFLIHRLGSNPALAIGVLAVYFLALILGRLVAQRLLPSVSHRRLLISSIATGMCGLLFLSYTRSLTGASVAALVIGAGFAPIYPLVAELLDDRFTYHPGFYNGAISVAITGAMGAPWLLGLVDAVWGMKYVMLLPACGSILVLMLSLLLMFEAHLMGHRAADS